jgi:hypothetical protein
MERGFDCCKIVPTPDADAQYQTQESLQSASISRNIAVYLPALARAGGSSQVMQGVRITSDGSHGRASTS